MTETLSAAEAECCDAPADIAPVARERATPPESAAVIAARLETAVWGAGIGMWELDFRIGWTRWLSDWCERLGLDPCDGKDHVARWDARIHPEDLAGASERFLNHIAGKEDYYDAEYRILDRQGRWRWLFERGRVVERERDGRPVRMVGVCMDIDSRKESELELVRSRQRLEVALESARGSMWDLDPQAGEPAQTDYFYRMLGVDPQEGVKEAHFWANRVHPEDVQRVREALRRTVEGAQELYEAVYRLRHADGTWRWVLDRGRAPERDASGWARRVVGFVVEITDRVQTQDALRRSEFRYRTVASMTPGYVYEYGITADGSVQPIWLSEGVQAVYGCSVEEYVARGGWDAFLEPEYQERFLECRRKVLEGFAQGGEALVRTVDGRQKWLYSSAIPLRDSQTGAVTGFIGAAHDITQRKLAEQERQSLEREIIQIANREQQRIGSDLHDGLGQDLTGIALMLRGIGAQLRREESASCMDVEDVIRLVNDAIDSTRALARGLSPVSTARDGLTGALQALAARATERYGIPVSVESMVGEALSLDETAATHLYRIAQEALTNVMRHSFATLVNIRLGITSGKLHLTINDNGCGFSKKANGSDGLGLKIMSYRAQMLDGELSFEASPTGGATVRCVCPISPGARAAAR